MMTRSDTPLPPDVRRLVRSCFAAQGAEQLALAIAPLIAVLAWGADASRTAWLQAGQTLPFLLLALPLGVLADRASRSRLMCAAELLRAATLLLLLLLALLWTQDSLSLVGLGLLDALGACGTVAYSVAAPALARRWTFGGLVACGPASALVAALLMAGSVAWPTLWLVAPAFVLFGAGPIVWTIATTSLRQGVTPPDMLGRVSSVILTATYGARPLGAALGALVAAQAGVAAALFLCVVGFALQWAILWRSPVRKLDTLPRAP